MPWRRLSIRKSKGNVYGKWKNRVSQPVSELKMKIKETEMLVLTYQGGNIYIQSLYTT